MDERRVLSVRRGTIVLAVVLVLALVLGAGPLWAGAKNVSSPVPRAIAVGLTAPFAAVNHVLHLEGARQSVLAAFRGAEAQAGVSHDEVADDPSSGPSAGDPASGMLTGAAALGAGAPTATHPATAANTDRKTVFDRKHPMHVLVVGDSLVGKLADSLVRMSDQLPLKVQFRYRISSGLVNTRFFDWPSETRRLVAQYHPDVTVMMFGNNDRLSLTAKGKQLAPFSPEWQAEYRKRVEAITGIVWRSGSHIVWVGMPIMRTDELNETARTLNRIFSSVCTTHEYWYVDAYRLFSNTKGKYAPYLKEPSGKTLVMRAPDGVHLSPSGGDRLARQVRRVLEQHYVLKQ